MIPYEAIGTGGVVGLAWLLRSIYSKRKNNSGSGPKPGTSKICIKNIGLISGHETLLGQLCVNDERREKAIIKLHDESREDYREINRKLDDLKGG